MRRIIRRRRAKTKQKEHNSNKQTSKAKQKHSSIKSTATAAAKPEQSKTKYKQRKAISTQRKAEQSKAIPKRRRHTRSPSRQTTRYSHYDNLKISAKPTNAYKPHFHYDQLGTYTTINSVRAKETMAQKRTESHDDHINTHTTISPDRGKPWSTHGDQEKLEPGPAGGQIRLFAKTRSRGPEKSIWRTLCAFASETLRSRTVYQLDLRTVSAVGSAWK